MAVSGLGQDGYVRIQKETTWGTGVTSSMTLLPAMSGSSFSGFPENIENDNVISSRVKQIPNQGRFKCSFEIQMKLHPTLIGLAMNLFLGTSTDAGPVDSTYTHTWLVPITGTKVGKSFTMQVAHGGDTAVQYVGCVFTKFGLKADNNGHIILTFSGVAKSYTTGIARISSFSYPSAIPLNFSMLTLNIDPADAAAFDQPCNSVEFEVDLNYELENFKTGSAYINNPVFKGIPSTMLKCNIDADKQFREAAQSHTLYANLITMASTEYAAGTTTYKTIIEIPKAKLNPETVIPFDNDRLSVDLDFDCSYGSTTTGSSSAVVQAEIRVVDATTAYA